MPVYEYRCPTCTSVFERRGSIADRDEASSCPSCGERGAKRLLAIFATIGGAAEVGLGAAPAGGGCCGGGCCGGG
jgi:putative FmdB family regulatory protein